jgi:phosphate:Na+ symporter
VAVSFLIIKMVSVLLFAGWTVKLGAIMKEWSPDASLPRLIANSHTVINVVLMLVILPISPQVARLADWIMGRAKEPEKASFNTLYLDQGMVSTPSLALNLAKQEIIRMGMIVRTMYSMILHPFMDKNPEILNKIYTHEQDVNFLRDSIKDYLVRINREIVSSSRVNESFQMLYTMNEFEKIGDIVSANLANRAERWSAMNYEFSEAGRLELKAFHEKVEKQLKRALVVFDETNLQKAAKMKSKHKEYRVLSHDLEKLHYARVLDGMKESIESSQTHLEVLALFSTIDTHATNIARIALEWNQKAD